MSNQIGTVPIGYIQEINFSDGTSVDEIDLVSEDSNIVVNGEDESKEVQISATLTKDSHPLSNDVEEQRGDIKQLPNNSVEENSFISFGKQGYISVENVNVPESSDLSTVREVEIEGKFLPWPKQFPKDRPTFFIFTDGTIDGTFSSGGNIFVLTPVSGSVFSKFNSSGSLNNKGALNGNINSQFTTSQLGYGVDYGSAYGEGESVVLSRITSFETDSKYNFISDTVLSSLFNFEGDADGNLDVVPVISTLFPLSAESVGNLTASGESGVDKSTIGAYQFSLESDGLIEKKRGVGGSLTSQLISNGEGNVVKTIDIDNLFSFELDALIKKNRSFGGSINSSLLISRDRKSVV